MKKPPAGRLAGAGSKVPAKAAKAAPKKTAAAKKPAAKKPGPGAAVAHKAHLAHVAHLAHLAHLGLPAPKATPKATPKPRQLALGEGVACCAAEAVAASLRLTGRPVGDADVLGLYRRTASDPDTGASILATLEAAYESGLAGFRAAWPPVPVPEGCTEYQHRHPSGTPPGRLETIGQLYDGARCAACDGERQEHPPEATEYPVEHLAHPLSMPLILGVELPGSHAVLATPEGWWSWGELHDPAQWPDAVIEEAWTLTWRWPE